MPKNFPRSGKRARPKTASKGKRLHCAKCRKRSPKPVKTPAPWYCPNCLEKLRESKGLAPAVDEGEERREGPY